VSLGESGEPVARYRGTVRVHWRIRNYHFKGTIGGEMSVYADHLRFCGVGIHRFELREYVISKSDVELIRSEGTADVPRFLRLLPIRRFGVRIISKPGGAFDDRDEYCLRFDTPTLDEVLAALQSAGYPVMDIAGSI
jgi:hypothetical protein